MHICHRNSATVQTHPTVTPSLTSEQEVVRPQEHAAAHVGGVRRDRSAFLKFQFRTKSKIEF